MANPEVCPYLKFYLEYSGGVVSNAYQAKHWLKDMDPDLLMPVIRQDNQVYFVFGPSTLVDQSVCMPVEWFICLGRMHAHAWQMLPSTRGCNSGWIVTK